MRDPGLFLLKMHSERNSRLGGISERTIIENNSLHWKLLAACCEELPTYSLIHPPYLSAPFHKYGDVCKVDGAHAEGVAGGRRRPRRGSAEVCDEQERGGVA